MSVRKNSAPRALLDTHKADEVLEAAVKLVRAHQRQRRSGDVPPKELAAHEARLRAHFPSISKTDAYRVANVLVDVGSLALRQALGLKVVLPEKQEVPPMPAVAPRFKPSPAFRIESGGARVALPDGIEVQLGPALAVMLGDQRMAVADVVADLETRGWQYVCRAESPRHSLLKYLDTSGLFRRVSCRGAATVAFRYVDPPVTEGRLRLDFLWYQNRCLHEPYEQAHRRISSDFELAAENAPSRRRKR